MVRSAENDQPIDIISTDKTDLHVVVIGVCASVSVLFVILFILALIRNCQSQHSTKEKSERGHNTDLSTIDKTAEPNPYIEIEQVVVQQKANASVETSAVCNH